MEQDQEVTFTVAQQEDAVVFAASTTHYDVFTLDQSNRPVNRMHVEKLKESISRRNMLCSYPIVVSSENGQWVVRDGQHRLVAAQELGVPIYYTFNDEMTMEDVPLINAPQKSWSTADYLHHYCARGLPEYLKLQEFWSRYPWMLLHVAVFLCHKGDNKDVRFKEGEFKCSDIEFAERVAQATLNFSRWVPFYREAVFIQAVGQLFEHAGYNHERMMRKMEFQSTRLVKCVNLEEYMRVFNTIYNCQSREQDRLHIAKINPKSKKRVHGRN